MGHYLHAIVGAPALLERIAARFPAAVVVPLSEALAMLPVPDPLVDEIDDAIPRAPLGSAPTQGLLHLCALEAFLAEVSRHGAVAYIETAYFGGRGTQGAAAFRDGRRLLAVSSGRPGPINAALRELGVLATDTRDEFDVVGLGGFRSTADVVERHGRSAASSRGTPVAQ